MAMLSTYLKTCSVTVVAVQECRVYLLLTTWLGTGIPDLTARFQVPMCTSLLSAGYCGSGCGLRRMGQA